MCRGGRRRSLAAHMMSILLCAGPGNAVSVMEASPARTTARRTRSSGAPSEDLPGEARVLRLAAAESAGFEVYALSTADRTIPRQIHLQYCRNAEGYKPVGVHLRPAKAAGLFYERELLTPFLHQIATRATHILGPIPEEGARIEEWQAYLTKLVDSFDKDVGAMSAEAAAVVMSCPFYQQHQQRLQAYHQKQQQEEEARGGAEEQKADTDDAPNGIGGEENDDAKVAAAQQQEAVEEEKKEEEGDEEAGQPAAAQAQPAAPAVPASFTDALIERIASHEQHDHRTKKRAYAMISQGERWVSITSEGAMQEHPDSTDRAAAEAADIILGLVKRRASSSSS